MEKTNSEIFLKTDELPTSSHISQVRKNVLIGRINRNCVINKVKSNV